MVKFLTGVFRLRAGETGIVLTLGFILLCNSLAHQISSVVSVSGFLSTVGVKEILLVWLVDYILIFFASGLQSLIVDRFDRVNLIKGVIFAFALTFCAIRLLFFLRAPSWLNYGLLYLISDQQWLFFPLVFWVLAGDVLDISQAKRLFPVIASVGFVGKIVGITIAAVSPSLLARVAAASDEILNLNVFIYLFAFMVAQWGLNKVKVRQIVKRHESTRETLTEGWAFIKEVPAFRYLTMAIIALILCDTIIEFHFLAVSDAVFRDPYSYQTFYSLYRMGITLAAFAVQSLLTSRIIEKIGLKNSFLVLPVSILVGLVTMTGLPGLVAGISSLASSIAGMVLDKLPRDTVDESARKAFQAFVPEERRGRVSLFMDSYVIAIGTVIGCLITVAIVFVGSMVGSASYFYVYLAVGIVAALLAVFAIHKMRAVWDVSLFNWRLKRRQRDSAGVLAKLDF
jgi:ATP:ADP antiporter, AAA family